MPKALYAPSYELPHVKYFFKNLGYHADGQNRSKNEKKHDIEEGERIQKESMHPNRRQILLDSYLWMRIWHKNPEKNLKESTHFY